MLKGVCIVRSSSIAISDAIRNGRRMDVGEGALRPTFPACDPAAGLRYTRPADPPLSLLRLVAMPEGAIFMIGGKAYQEGTAYAAPAPPRNSPHSSLHGATLTRRATTPPAVNSTACASRAR